MKATEKQCTAVDVLLNATPTIVLVAKATDYTCRLKAILQLSLTLGGRHFIGPTLSRHNSTLQRPGLVEVCVL